jgi:hypothetical protein
VRWQQFLTSLTGLFLVNLSLVFLAELPQERLSIRATTLLFGILLPQTIMGGHTFGVEARRLTTQQHAALFAHIRTALDPFTPFGLRTTISPDDKVSHGDLDVMIGSWAEGPGFKYQFAGQAEEFDIHSHTPSKVWYGIAGTRGSQWTEDDLRNWIRDVARAIRAIVWQTHRLGAIFAVPCSILGALTADADGNEVGYRIFSGSGSQS